MMKNLLTVLLLVTAVTAMGQNSDLFGTIKKTIGGGKGSSSLSTDDVIAGLKQALTLGAEWS